MLKRMITGLLVLGLIGGLGAITPASATEAPPPCQGCPPVPPPEAPCGVQEVVVQTEVWVGDCTPCFTVCARLLEDCSPCAAVVDTIGFEWCREECGCTECGCAMYPWPAVGPNGILWIEDFVVTDGVATVTLRLIADPAVFDGSIFGNDSRGIEVTVNGVTSYCCAAFDCKLGVGGNLGGGKGTCDDRKGWGSQKTWFARGCGTSRVQKSAGAFKFSCKAGGGKNTNKSKSSKSSKSKVSACPFLVLFVFGCESCPTPCDEPCDCRDDGDRDCKDKDRCDKDKDRCDKDKDRCDKDKDRCDKDKDRCDKDKDRCDKDKDRCDKDKDRCDKDKDRCDKDKDRSGDCKTSKASKKS